MIDPIDSSESTIRLLASEALKLWPLDAVYNLLFDDDYVVRTLAARQLQLRGDKDIFEKMVALSFSPIPFHRVLSAFVLGQLGTPAMPFKNYSIPTLLRLISDDNQEVRAFAADALGHLCYAGMPAEAEQILYGAASDHSPIVRGAAAVALGNASNHEQALSVLDMLIQDPVKEVREYAELGKEILLNKRV